MTYSIAIRTLGKDSNKLCRELESIKRLTPAPDKVLIYIAEGFPRPDFQIGKEQYIWVKKGMMAQRLLNYDEIDSDLILFLDDDVELAPDSIANMLKAIEENNLDAIGADVFQNHRMPLSKKIYSAIVNCVTPHFRSEYAFKIKYNGAFSYHNNPGKNLYLSQSCGGPAWMIRKSVYEKLRFQDELWLDKFDFAYGEDQLETYKIYINGYKLGVMFNSGIKNLNGETDSRGYKKNRQRLYIKTKASFIIWWRTVFMSPRSISEKYFAGLSFSIKTLWSIIPISVFSLKSISFSPLTQFLKGNIDAWKLIHSREFKSLPPYVISKS